MIKYRGVRERLTSRLIFAALAQLDRVFGYEPKGRGFESLTPCHEKDSRLYNLESFSTKSAVGGINPHSWMKSLRDEILLRKIRDTADLI